MLWFWTTHQSAAYLDLWYHNRATFDLQWWSRVLLNGSLGYKLDRGRSQYDKTRRIGPRKLLVGPQGRTLEFKGGDPLMTKPQELGRVNLSRRRQGCPIDSIKRKPRNGCFCHQETCLYLFQLLQLQSKLYPKRHSLVNLIPTAWCVVLRYPMPINEFVEQIFRIPFSGLNGQVEKSTNKFASRN